MIEYAGDYAAGATVKLSFNTTKADGTAITLAGTPVVSVYQHGSDIETVTGVALVVDYDSRTGYHHVTIDTSSDGEFYAGGNDFDVVITTGTVDGVDVAGASIGGFSIENRTAAVRDKTGFSIAGTKQVLDDLNDISPSEAVTAAGQGVLRNPYDLLTTGGEGYVVVETNLDKGGYEISGSLTTLDSLNAAIPAAILKTPENLLATDADGNVVASTVSDLSPIALTSETSVDGLPILTVLTAIMALAGGKTTVTDGGSTLTTHFKKRDGSTTMVTIITGSAEGVRTDSTVLGE